MSEPKLISPLLDNFYMGDAISEHDGVRCYPAMERISEDKYIIKVISSPATQVQMEALLLSGAYSDRTAALSYFKSVADDIAGEVKILDKLAQLEGFIPCQGCQVVPMDDEGGYDVYLLNPYYRTLERQMRKSPITHLEALNLGLDLCAALAVCRRCGYLYVDLKPENIAVLPDKQFRIADIGFIRLDSLKYASLPDRYRSKYTAPEIADAFSSLNMTMDIYSVGMILYQIFNGGQIPTAEEGGALSAPAYADYEMSEIILKACAENPEDRWQDPVDMGQALVGYMQRNGAHDTPIVSVVAPAGTVVTEDTPSEADGEPVGLYETTDENAEPAAENAGIADDTPQESSVEETAAEADSVDESLDAAEDPSVLFTEDEQGNLTFLIPDSEDETAPENSMEEVEYSEVTPELSSILAQADDLIAHQVPDPAVAPEPVEVVVPDTEQVTEPADAEQPAEIENEEAVKEDSSEEPADTPLAEDGNEAVEKPEADEHDECNESEDSGENPQEDSTESNDDTSDAEVDNAEVDNADDADECNDDDEEGDNKDDEEDGSEKKPNHILRTILLSVLCLILIAAGILFYKFYYLQPIDDLRIDDGENGILTVVVTSPVPHDQLTVLCIDTYGNQLSSQVLNGKARFSGLAPNTAYTVEVDIKGFHGLTGKTSAKFTTPDLTEIVQFQALTGNEDGSVILSLTPDGTEPEEWIIRYKNDDGEEVKNTFSGNVLTLSGLTVGKEYTFTLSTDTELRLSGETTVTHTASKIVKPVNVRITGCYQGKLGVKWDAPEGSEVTGWTIRCYNENGYDKTVTSETTEAAFDIPDDSAAYTVDVTAAGMSISERASAEANSITVGVFEADTSSPTQLVLTWKSSQEVPEGGWIMVYTIDGTTTYELKDLQDNTATVAPLVPGCTYEFKLQTAAGNTVLGGTYTYNSPEASQFEGYAVTASNMEFLMCKRPSNSDWDHYDVPTSSYRTEFSLEEKASYVIRMRSEYNTSNDVIVAVFAIRDKDGNIVSATSSSKTWTKMWYRGYCELDIPQLPKEPGEYTISVYFNNGLVNQNSFTIVD